MSAPHSHATALRLSTALALLLLLGCTADNSDTETAVVPKVDVVTVASNPVKVTRGLPGRTSPYRVALVRPQVSGLIEKRLFNEGEQVKQGQALYQIDSAEYQANYDNAAADVARAEALAKSADNQAQRLNQLINSNVVSERDVDAAVAAADEARADVAAAKATLSSASIELDRTTIKAPITGRIGRSLVTEGALVTANQETELAVITTLDPIYVDLSQSSADLLRWKRRLAAGEFDTGIEGLRVTLSLEDGTEYPHKGSFEFSDVRVNTTTGSILVRALFPNPDGLLLPGMFVTAVILEGVRADGVLVPQQAVMRNPQGQALVYVVNANNIIEQQVVTAERTVGNQWLLADAALAGKRVMTAGFQFAYPGERVSPIEAEASAESAPEIEQDIQQDTAPDIAEDTAVTPAPPSAAQ